MSIEAAQLHVGQEVILGGRNQRDRDSVGHVVKIGRKLVHIQGQYGPPVVFRLDTQYTNDERESQWFRTLAQQADAEQAAHDWALLKAHGFEPRLGYSPSRELLHVAAGAIRSHLAMAELRGAGQ